MEPDTRACGIICGVAEGELEQYKARLIAEGWIIEKVTPYQYYGSPIYYEILIVEEEERTDVKPPSRPRS